MSDNTCGTCNLGYSSTLDEGEKKQELDIICCNSKSDYHDSVKPKTDTCPHWSAKEEKEWWCYHCKAIVPPIEVTHDEKHEVCGYVVNAIGVEDIVCDPPPDAQRPAGEWKAQSILTIATDFFQCFIVENSNTVCRVDGTTKTECQERVNRILSAPTLAAENRDLRTAINDALSYLDSLFPDDGGIGLNMGTARYRGTNLYNNLTALTKKEADDDRR